eukprot:gene11016-19859_t
MKKKVLDVLNPYEDICLLGDGRNDSPGFSARYCVYVIIEHVTGVLVDLEVLDRRETGGHSPNMEREGLTRLLLCLMHEIDITEILTDASSSIIKGIKELQGLYPHCEKWILDLLEIFLEKNVTKNDLEEDRSDVSHFFSSVGVSPITHHGVSTAVKTKQGKRKLET